MEKYKVAWLAACILHNMAVTRNVQTQENAAFERELESEAVVSMAAAEAEETASRSARHAAFAAGYDYDATSTDALRAGKEKRDAIRDAMN